MDERGDDLTLVLDDRRRATLTLRLDVELPAAGFDPAIAVWQPVRELERRIAKRSAQGVAHLGGLGSFPEVEDEAATAVRASRVRRRPTRKARGTEATAKSSSHQKNCETVSDTGAMNAARRKMRMAAAEVAKTGASTRRRGAEAARQRRTRIQIVDPQTKSPTPMNVIPVKLIASCDFVTTSPFGGQSSQPVLSPKMEKRSGRGSPIRRPRQRSRTRASSRDSRAGRSAGHGGTAPAGCPTRGSRTRRRSCCWTRSESSETTSGRRQT